MGGFRSQPLLIKDTLLKEGNIFSYAVTSMCGWRLFMEDAHICATLTDKKMHLFAVFDGHGGAEVSTFAERHFIEELERNKNFRLRKYQLALKQTFLKIDELLATPRGKKQIYEIQLQMRKRENAPNYDEPSRAGCTANVCLITPEFIYVANAGDSRAVCCTSKGETKQLSRDHKPDDKIQTDRIKKAGGEINFGRVNGSLNLSRALGDLQYKQNRKFPPQQQIITANPDVSRLKNQNIDFIIMGCDGIWQIKSNSQMVAYIKTKLDEKRAITQIVQQLLDDLISKDSQTSEYGMDNMSAILIKFHCNKK